MSDILRKIKTHTALILLSLACIVPFVMIVFSSFSSEMGLAKYGYSFFPKLPTLDAYRYVLNNVEPMIRAFGLTIFVTVVGTVTGVFSMTACAYALSREDFKLRTFLSFFIYFTMLFNGGTVAGYLWIARYLKLSNSVAVLILGIMINAWNIFILRVHCKAIPFSLIESAKLDGASEIYIFFRIIIPLAKTGIATIALLVAFAYWNEWYLSMLYIDGSDKCTIQYYLVKVLNNVQFAKTKAGVSGGLTASLDIPDVSVRMAICVVATLPIMLVFPFFQKYFVKGITIGAVKG